MDRWSVALLAVAGYVAVTALVRLMVRRRDQLLHEFRRQLRSGKTEMPTAQSKSKQPGEERKAA